MSDTISLTDARTARSFDIETTVLAEQSQPGEPFYGIAAGNGGRVVISDRRNPVAAQPKIVGGVGVGGGDGDRVTKPWPRRA